MDCLQVLASKGLCVSQEHDYSSTEVGNVPSNNSLKFLVYPEAEFPKGEKILYFGISSNGHVVYLSDNSDYKGPIWYGETLEEATRKAIQGLDADYLPNLIASAFEWIEANNPQYLDTVIKQNSGWAGEFDWRKMVNCAWKTLPVHEYKSFHKPDYTYLYLELDESCPQFLLGQQNTRLLHTFNRRELKSVEVVGTPYGIKLVSPLVIPTEAKIVWLVIGTAKKDEQLIEGYTMPLACAPGELTASFKDIPLEYNWDASLWDLWAIAKEENYPIAVRGMV